jgi:hypothetical protein
MKAERTLRHGDLRQPVVHTGRVGRAVLLHHEKTGVGIGQACRLGARLRTRRHSSRHVTVRCWQARTARRCESASAASSALRGLPSESGQAGQLGQVG